MKTKPFARRGNFTGIDNYIFDYVMPSVTPNAFKVICLIARKTKGWHKESIQLTYNDIKSGTGISSDATVSKSVLELVTNHLIIVDTNRAYEGNFYELNKDLEVEVQDSSTTENEVLDDSSTSINDVQKPSTSVFGGTSTSFIEVQESEKTGTFTPDCTTENEVPKESIKQNNIPPTEVALQRNDSLLSVPLSAQFHVLLEELKTAKNRQAKLRQIYILCYGETAAPTFSYLGTIATKVGGAGFLAHRLIELTARPPNGDVLAYILAEYQRVKARRNGKAAIGDNAEIWHEIHSQEVPDYMQEMLK